MNDQGPMDTKIIDLRYKGLDLPLPCSFHDGKESILIFIHGLGCSRESFIDLWRYPEFQKYTCIVPDLLGFGEAPRPGAFSYAMEDHAGVCRALLDHFPGAPVSVVGHSMGGAIGVILAGMIPERIASFFNVEGNLFRTDCSVSRSAASVMDFSRFRDNLFRSIRILTPGKMEKGTELWAGWIEKSWPDGFNRSARSLVEWTDSGELLKGFLELRARKAYVCGERNSRRKILERLQGIRIISISGSGHFPMNDNPDEFYRVLAAFLSEDGRGEAAE